MASEKTHQLGIVCFGRDLRLGDNPALVTAAKRCERIVPVFIWAPEEEAPWAPGAAGRWWLHHSLADLASRLEALGAPLVLRAADTRSAELKTLIKETGATFVAWNRSYDPAQIARDKAIKAELLAQGLEVSIGSNQLLFEPWAVETGQGGPYKVFTPYYNKILSMQEAIPKPVAAPRELRGGKARSLPIEKLALLPAIEWYRGFESWWTPGEPAARASLKKFLRGGVEGYRAARDLPSVRGTSELSAHLHFGEIGPRQIWAELTAGADGRRVTPDETFFLREMIWREFSHHLLYHFPKTPAVSLRPEFERFPWKRDDALFDRWKRGTTGYPIVDAGMRQLWQTGWMHNRVRMIVGSFLVKDLLESWRRGAAWFWDTLVDADLANNTLGWQWIGGCGADASPFFRVFNPTLQGEKFDPEGEYVKLYCPELAKLPKKYVHRPFEAPGPVLEKAGVRLGRDYPLPIVDHGEARDAAIRAFKTLRG